jgi:hypothetical protein
VNVDDGFLNLMTSDGTAKDDVKVPEGDLGKQITTEFEEGKDLLVTIVSAMGEEQVTSPKSVQGLVSTHVTHFRRSLSKKPPKAVKSIQVSYSTKHNTQSLTVAKVKATQLLCPSRRFSFYSLTSHLPLVRPLLLPPPTPITRSFRVSMSPRSKAF